MMEEQTDSLWSTIDLNKEVGNGCSEEDALQVFVNKLCTYVFFTNHLIKLLNTPNLTLAYITFFTIPSMRVLRPGNLLIRAIMVRSALCLSFKWRALP